MVGTNSYVAKLKAQLDRAIIQREHWKQLAENRNSILVTEVCPESRSVEEHIIDADSVRASWRLMRGYREQIEALRAENGRLQADRDRANQYANQQALECNKLSTDLEAARGLLRESRKSYTEAIHWEDQQPVMKKIDAFLTAFPVPEVRCQTCDGTGDVHRSDGEWLGECHCVKTEQRERQEVWARQCDLDESDPALFVSRERVEESGYMVRLTTAPQPGPDVRALVEALENCAAALAWNCFGECRAVHAGPIMPAAMALDTARATLAAHRQAQRQ